MSYIGNPPAEAYTNTVKDTFSGDGSTTAFTMSQISLTNDVRVVVENVVQDPTVAYSCAGTTLTFTSAPPTGTNNIYVVHLGPAVMTALPPAEIAQATTFNSNVSVGGNLIVDTNTLYVDSTNNTVGIGGSASGFGSGVATLQLTGTASGSPTRAGALRFRSQNGTSSICDIYSDNGFMAFYTGTSATTSERMRLDSSGHLLFAKTSTSSGVAGIRFAYDAPGYAEFTRDGGNPLFLNRETDHGYIIRFAKDNSYVGSIGTFNGSHIYLAGSDTGIKPENNVIYGTNSTGSALDNTVDIGASSYRIKDLYLSGGVYLGGTGAANKLDDYEEGTWTVTLTPSTSGTISLAGGGGAFYTKIGQVVHISISVTNNSSSSPVGYIGFNLPFAAASGSQKGRSALALYFDGVASSNVADFIGLTIDGTSEGRIYLGDNPVTQSDSAQQMDGTCYILISGSYITSA